MISPRPETDAANALREIVAGIGSGEIKRIGMKAEIREVDCPDTPQCAGVHRELTGRRTITIELQRPR